MSVRGKKTTRRGAGRTGARRGAASALRHEIALSDVGLRIIAGRWRGRRWRFPVAEGLRPTPNRVRETLFNWLAPRIAGARCLDLFAGSGALGLEALSRGAASVIFVDQHPDVIDALRARIDEWQAADSTAAVAEFYLADAAVWLNNYNGAAFDLVFLDPPFALGSPIVLLDALRARRMLAAGAWVYLEQPAEAPLPGAWQVHRSGRAGAVGYHLLYEA